MHDQNQNVQPDYSFITAQPGPPVKKTPKPLYLFAGVIGVFVLLIGVLFVFSRNNVRKVADGPKFDSAAQVPEQYLRHVSDSQYTDAFKLFTKESQNIATEDTFTKMAPVILANFDMSKCAVIDSASGGTITYNCPTKSGEEMQFVFTVVQEDDTYRISRYDITGASNDGASNETQS